MRKKIKAVKNEKHLSIHRKMEPIKTLLTPKNYSIGANSMHFYHSLPQSLNNIFALTFSRKESSSDCS